MRLHTRAALSFQLSEHTPLLLMLRPRSGAAQWIAQETYSLQPHTAVIEFTDGNGNLCQRLIAPPGPFRVVAEAEVVTSGHLDVSPGAPFVPVPDLPEVALPFLLPSRYCESDRLGERARELTAGALPGYDQVAAICAWVNTHIAYRYGTSDASTSALDTHQRGAGVCRDFAHLAIALCRALSIPARMVVGFHHALPVMDLHAWLEAYVGGRWYAFDATQAWPQGGRVALAYGRDAADVAMVTQFGTPAVPLVEVSVRVLEAD
jgi:transglutaminase-like putative cysteine protease